MKKLIKVFILASVLVSTSGYGTTTVMGVAAGNCETWIKDKEEGCEAYSFNRVYLLGFLTGVNSLAPKDIMADRDVKRLFESVDNYCKEHPDDIIYEAFGNLATELNK